MGRHIKKRGKTMAIDEGDIDEGDSPPHKKAKRYVHGTKAPTLSTPKPIYSEGLISKPKSVLTSYDSCYPSCKPNNLHHSISTNDGFSYNSPTNASDALKQPRNIGHGEGVDGYYVCPFFNEQNNGHHPILPYLLPLDLCFKDLDQSPPQQYGNSCDKGEISNQKDDDCEDKENENNGSTANHQKNQNQWHQDASNSDANGSDSDSNDDANGSDSEISFEIEYVNHVDDEALIEQHSDFFESDDSREQIIYIGDQNFSESDTESEESTTITTMVSQQYQNDRLQQEMEEAEDSSDEDKKDEDKKDEDKKDEDKKDDLINNHSMEVENASNFQQQRIRAIFKKPEEVTSSFILRSISHPMAQNE